MILLSTGVEGSGSAPQIFERRTLTEAQRIEGIVTIREAARHRFAPFHGTLPSWWEPACDEALQAALRARSDAAVFDIYQRLAALLNETRTLVRNPPEIEAETGELPVRLEAIGSGVVIREGRAGSVDLAAGSLELIEGVPLFRVRASVAPSVSAGSPETRAQKELEEFVRGPAGTSFTLFVGLPGKGPEAFLVSRLLESEPWHQIRKGSKDGVSWIDVPSFSPEAAELISQSDRNTPLVVDLRRAQDGNPARVVSTASALKKRRASTAFLTAATTAGPAEALLQKLKEIGSIHRVGARTAGSSGAIEIFQLPGGACFELSPEGPGTGVFPTDPIAPTFKRATEGADEVLEKGFEVVRRKGASGL